jgi:hypothetical protein
MLYNFSSKEVTADPSVSYVPQWKYPGLFTDKSGNSKTDGTSYYTHCQAVKFPLGIKQEDGYVITFRAIFLHSIQKTDSF